jgi:hypothetical protein
LPTPFVFNSQPPLISVGVTVFYLVWGSLSSGFDRGDDCVLDGGRLAW